MAKLLPFPVEDRNLIRALVEELQRAGELALERKGELYARMTPAGRKLVMESAAADLMHTAIYSLGSFKGPLANHALAKDEALSLRVYSEIVLLQEDFRLTTKHWQEENLKGSGSSAADAAVAPHSNGAADEPRSFELPRYRGAL